MGKLGICVSTRNNLDHVIGIARAAHSANHDVEVFFTGEGVNLCSEPRFQELLPLARVAVCEVSYFAAGHKGKEVPGLRYKDFVTQGRNAEMVEQCSRYIML